LSGEAQRIGVHITIVYDNYAYNPAARVSSGFACIVKTSNQTILFDTGIHGPTLLYNLGQLGFTPQEIDSIVISHIDGDHIGGLFKFLEENRDVRVYVPRSFPIPFKEMITIHGAAVMEVGRRRQVSPGVETTGEMGTWIKEQALMVRTHGGVVVIAGDTHSGIINVIKKAKRLIREKISMVVGGFSLGGASQADLESIVNSFKRLGVEKVAPCHSSGDRTRELFQKEYKENYIECGVGRVIELE